MKNLYHWFWFVIISLFISSMVIIISTTIKSQLQIEFLEYDQFDYYVKMQRRNDDNVLVRANNSLEDIYQFNDFPPISTPIDKIWNLDEKFKNNSHELYAHSLTILWDLIIAHQKTQNDLFLVKGKEIILSWIKENHRINPMKSRYAWNDHSTATRTINILLFIDYYNMFYEVDGKLTDDINKYCSDALYFLSNPLNYTYRHNHGIFQDIALLFLSKHMSKKSLSSKYIQTAIKRFEKQIITTISPKGIHLENSAGYNFVISNQIQTFLTFLGNNEYLTDEVLERIRLLEENKSAFIFPNNELVPVGDTHRHKFYYDIKIDSNLCLYDTLAGYGIFRNKEKEYLLIRSNGILPNHLHQDCFSFVYYTNDNIIITDTGFLDYSSSIERQFSKSVQAHNSILPTILLDKFNIQAKCLFKSYTKNDNYYYSELLGEIEQYPVKREFLLNNEKYLLIVDSLFQEYPEDWIRIFNLSEYVKEVNAISDTVIEIKMINGDIYFFTSYKNPLGIVKGSNSPKIGWLAEPLRHLEPSYAIIQRNTKRKTKLLIGISKNDPIKFDHEKGNHIILNYPDNDTILFETNNITINGDILEKINLEKSYNIEQKNNLFYKTWLRIRDYRIQLLFLNSVALLLIILITFIFNYIRMKSIKFWIYSIFTIILCYSSIIFIFLIYFK